MIRRLRKHVEWLRHARVLDDIRTMDEFHEHIERTKPSEFLMYERMSGRKRVEAQALLDHLGLSVAGKRTLDLGPGRGESLDVFREQGAGSCVFAERDPIFYTYNRLKGFDGYRCNFIRQLERLNDRPHDFVYVGHSVSYRNFRLQGAKRFSRWLDDLKQLVSANGAIAISPWWPPGTSGLSRDDLLEHWFGCTLMDAGFEPLPWIKGHNRDVVYPLTFLAPGQRKAR